MTCIAITNIYYFWDHFQKVVGYYTPLALLVLALVYPRSVTGAWYVKLMDCFASLARRRGRAVVAVGLLAFAYDAILCMFVYWPEPIIHDEFSHLLAARTFAMGRLTNPTPPLWEHFETFHVLFQPTYMSKYPPGQGLILALGIWLTGEPLVGVWLSVGMACAAICWMLQGWMRPTWALLGGLMAVCQLVFTESTTPYAWGLSYWGGAVPAFGGALIFGAVRRLLVKPSVGMATVFALGLVVLANSRPSEGLICSLACLGLLLTARIRQWLSWSDLVLKICLPVTVVLAGAGAWMGYYNWRVTGAWYRMPYILYEEQYAVQPIYLFQPLLVPTEHADETIQDFQTWCVKTWYSPQKRLKTAGWFVLERKLYPHWQFYFGWLLSIPLLALPWVVRRPWMGFAALTWALMLIPLLVQVWWLPHYAAPWAGIQLLLVVQGIRHLRLLDRHGFAAGRRGVRGLLTAFLFVSLVTPFRSMPFQGVNFGQNRAERQEKLQEQAERQRRPILVLARYEPTHVFHWEWVFNEPDIERAPVIWARVLRDDSKNQELREFFKDRTIIELELP